MKIKILLLFTILIQVSCQSQKNDLRQDFSKSPIIKHAKKLAPKSYRKIIKLELENIFTQVLTTHKIDLSSADTLYIIQGFDITNGCIYGRIWNDKIMIHYFDDRGSEDGKLLLNPKISTTKNSTTDFDSLIEDIENNNQEFITKKAKENQVLSGIPGWGIMSFKKNESQQYETIYFTVFNFAIHEELKLD